MLDLLHARAEQAVALAQAAGANGVFAWATRSREVQTRYRDGALEAVEESTSRGLSLEIHADGRYSTHSTTDLREDRLQSFVREAVALTRALQPDPFRQLTDPKLFEGRSAANLDLVDAKVHEIEPARRAEWLAALDATARGAPEVISASSWVADGHNLGAGCSSNGFSGDWESTSAWYGVDITLKDGEDARPEEGTWAGGHHVSALPDPVKLAAEALSRAQGRLGSKRGPTAKTTMIVEPRAASRLIGALLRPARAASVQQGRSFWTGKLGQPLFSKQLTLTDEPLLPRGLNSRLFDGEGIAARPLTLIEGGVAKNIFVDTYYGRKLSMAPTTGGGSNLVVARGARDLAAIIAAASDAVLVTSWLGGNSDDNTGDFSYGLRGFRVSGGKVGEPIGEMNATGSLTDLFARLVEVGNDPFPYASVLTPTMVFEGVQFSGA